MDTPSPSHFPNGKSVICAGCQACKMLCPADAISVDFRRAAGPVMSVDASSCLHCNRCSSRCPQLNSFTPDRSSPSACYAVMAPDPIRAGSASGGAFPVLACEILRQGGAVCGAVWNGFCVEHTLACNEPELAAMYGSKYVRSDLNDVYPRIAALLEQNRPVLFAGCPCQVAGLYAFLGSDHPQLTTIDLICHFAPGAELFERYRRDCYPPHSLQAIRFRPKELSGWDGTTLLASFVDGRRELKSTENDPYLRGYHNRLLMPAVCEACRYSGDMRQGDLTIGDFWFIDQYRKDLDDKKGTSIVLTNSQKGQMLLKCVQANFQKIEPVPADLLHTNRPVHSQAHPQRDHFFQLLHQGKPFQEALEVAMEYPYDLGIVSIWSEPNYGSELTYYALYCVITQMGLKPLMIERPTSAAWAAQAPDKTLFQQFPYPANAIAPPYRDTLEMYQLNDVCRGFLVGSDQMWHPQLYRAFGEYAFLKFAQDNKLKVAYATSFGCERWQSDSAMQCDISHSLQRFDALSVRETSGVDLLKHTFGLSGDLVLDPIFLCGRQVLDELSAKAHRKPAAPFLGTYLLDMTPQKEQAVRQYAEKYGLQPNTITDAKQACHVTTEALPVISDASLEEWLYNFAMADFVITDSYHGMCLCLLYHKPFFCIANTSRGLTRFQSLLSILHLENRLVMDPAELIQKADQTPAIDFENVDAILQPLIQDSRQWLKNALNISKASELTEADQIRADLLRISRRMDESSADPALLSRMVHDLADHQEKIVAHGTMLLRHDTAVSEHTRRLADDEVFLGQHQQLLEAHGKMLLEQDAQVAQHAQRLTDDEGFLSQHQSILEAHGKMLLENESKMLCMEKQISGQEAKLLAQEQQLSEMRQQLADTADKLQHYLKFMTQLSDQFHELQDKLSSLQQENADLRQQVNKPLGLRSRMREK